MSRPRILATNRRERGGRQVDLGTVALTAAAWLLALFASLRRHREPKKVQERPARASDVQDDAYADHLYAEPEEDRKMSGWTDSKWALLALLILCDEADEQEAQEQFPREPGSARSVKRRAAEWLASRLAFADQ